MAIIDRRRDIEVSDSGDAHFREGRFPEAKADYLQALSNDPENARTLARLGTLSLYENRADDAVRYLKGALERGSWLKRRWPLNVPLSARVAIAYHRIDRFRQAAYWFAAAAGPLPFGPFRQLAGLARHVALFGDEPPYRIDGPLTTRIAFVMTDPLPVIELSVNDRPGSLFFIDTGGAEIVLDAGFAMEAEADMAGAMRGEYAGRKKAKTGLGTVASVRAGEMRVEHVPIHTLDLSAFPGFFGLDVKGIVGTRFLMHFLATIDYVGAQLVLRRDPNADVAGPKARRIPFWLAEEHLILARGALNDLPPTLFWADTGLAGSGFTASESTLRAAGVAIDWSRAREGPGGGGMVKETDVVIDRLTLGEGDHAVTRHDVPGVLMEKAPSILGGALGFEVGGLISHGFFRRYALTLDFANMRLILDPVPSG